MPVDETRRRAYKSQWTRQTLESLNFSALASQAAKRAQLKYGQEAAAKIIPKILQRDIDREAQRVQGKGLQATLEFARLRFRAETKPDTWDVMDQIADRRAEQQPPEKIDEFVRKAQLEEQRSKAARQEAGDWRPAGSPSPGGSGALAGRPLSEGQIPQNVNLPPTFNRPTRPNEQPDTDEYGETEEDIESQEIEGELEEAALLQAAEEEQQLRRLAESTATSKLEEDAQDKIREEVKRTAKAAFKRAIIYLVDLIGGCLDLGTATMSTIIDIFVYIFTFSWLNLEMIYGSYIAKGKSKIISPLTWAPIPFPGDKNGILLHGALIAADMLLLLAIVCVFGFGLLLLYVAASAMENTYGTIFSLITGSGELGFLGDLFKTWIGI